MTEATNSSSSAEINSEDIENENLSDNSNFEEYNTIIENQQTIIDNQNSEIEYLNNCVGILSGIYFCCIIAIGIALAIRFGQWIWSLIRC